MQEQHRTSEEEHRPGVESTALTVRVARAWEMLSSFSSVGVKVFDLTLTDVNGKKTAYRSSRPLEWFSEHLSSIVETGDSRVWNVIIRPHGGERITPIQLDDLDSEKLTRVRPFSFLVLETSPANHQAWVAVNNASEDLIRALRIEAGADTHASGATRAAGTLNVKPKYKALPTFPTVALLAATPSLVVSEDELRAAGLLPEAPLKIAPPPGYAPPADRQGGRARIRWPSYERCLEAAGPARNHDGADRSAADYQFVLISLDRGWGVEETAAKLLEVSEKAQGEGSRYARHTAEHAAGIIAKRRGHHS